MTPTEMQSYSITKAKIQSESIFQQPTKSTEQNKLAPQINTSKVSNTETENRIEIPRPGKRSRHSILRRKNGYSVLFSITVNIISHFHKSLKRIPGSHDKILSLLIDLVSKFGRIGYVVGFSCFIISPRNSVKEIIW